jgi:hypothetical protein
VTIALFVVDIFVAIGTLLMALFTYRLAKKTSDTSESTKTLADETRVMAKATLELAVASKAEADASMEQTIIAREGIANENAPYLTIKIHIQNRSEGQGKESKPVVIASVKNIGKGPAIGCQIAFNEKYNLVNVGQDIPPESVILATSEPFSLGAGEFYENKRILASYYSRDLVRKLADLLSNDRVTYSALELGAVFCTDIFGTQFRFFTDPSISVDKVTADQLSKEGNPGWSYDPNIRNLTLKVFFEDRKKSG